MDHYRKLRGPALTLSAACRRSRWTVEGPEQTGDCPSRLALNDRPNPNLSFECSGLGFALRCRAACPRCLMRVSRGRRLVSKHAVNVGAVGVYGRLNDSARA